LVLPVAHELSTAAVYAHADSLQTVRSQRELEDKRRALVTVLSLGTPAPSSDLLTNDLQRAAVDLCPEIKKVLRQAADSGADEVLLSGSGPTVIGLFLRANPLARVARAIAGLPERVPEPIAAEAVGGEFGAVWRRGASQSIGI
jgi:4-diphosphocytidyl-2C-methyl-D-erythritol kinase